MCSMHSAGRAASSRGHRRTARTSRRNVAPPGQKGDFVQAIGRSRGGRTTKIRAIADETGRPVALTITPGQTHDPSGAKMLLAIIATPCRFIADRAYDAKQLRAWLTARGFQPVIPPNPHVSIRTLTTAPPTVAAMVSSTCSAGSRTSEGSQHATTSAQTSSWLQSSSLLHSSGGSIESGP